MTQRLPKQLGAFLRKQRGDLTYQQFSRKMGLPASTLHRLEMGGRNVTLKTLEHLRAKLKCRSVKVAMSGSAQSGLEL